MSKLICSIVLALAANAALAQERFGQTYDPQAALGVRVVAGDDLPQWELVWSVFETAQLFESLGRDPLPYLDGIGLDKATTGKLWKHMQWSLADRKASEAAARAQVCGQKRSELAASRSALAAHFKQSDASEDLRRQSYILSAEILLGESQTQLLRNFAEKARASTSLTYVDRDVALQGRDPKVIVETACASVGKE